MFLKTKISEIFTKGVLRFFKMSLWTKQSLNLVQFHAGGDDYCPTLDVEGLGGSIGNNPKGGFVFVWRDSIERKSKQGEKRIYSVSPQNPKKVVSEVYLKNDGTIEISGDKDLKIVVLGNCNLKCETANIETTTSNIKASASVNIDSPVTNIGQNGKGIARIDDTVEVYIGSGSSAGTWSGKITSSGVNTSI